MWLSEKLDMKQSDGILFLCSFVAVFIIFSILSCVEKYLWSHYKQLDLRYCLFVLLPFVIAGIIKILILRNEKRQNKVKKQEYMTWIKTYTEIKPVEIINGKEYVYYVGRCQKKGSASGILKISRSRMFFIGDKIVSLNYSDIIDIQAGGNELVISSSKYDKRLHFYGGELNGIIAASIIGNMTQN